MQTYVFRAIRTLVYSQSGIELRDGKKAMVQARLGRRMRALGLTDHRQYLRYLREDDTGEEMRRLLDAISTNVTRFFREPQHFEYLRGAAERWAAAGQCRFRLWSAACSSGEEAYSMGMVMLEATRGRAVDLKILATDISTRVLERARVGLYDDVQMRPVPKVLRLRYFDRVRRGEGSLWSVGPELRSHVVFRRMNLASTPYPMHGPLDAIFARNVMIYFDTPGRRRLLDEVKRLVGPDGYVFVGHAESLAGILSGLAAVAPSIYTKGPETAP